MSKFLRSAYVIALVLLLGAAVDGCTTVTGAPSPELLQQIESARSGPDHLALAAYYGREATVARARAAEHRKMAQSYPPNAGARGVGSIRAHCHEIAKKFDSIAVEFDALAMEHQALAAQVKP